MDYQRSEYIFCPCVVYYYCSSFVLTADQYTLYINSQQESKHFFASFIRSTEYIHPLLLLMDRFVFTRSDPIMQLNKTCQTDRYICKHLIVMDRTAFPDVLRISCFILYNKHMAFYRWSCTFLSRFFSLALS